MSTVSFTGPVWTMHAVFTFDVHKVTGVKISLTPDFLLGKDYIFETYTFSRLAQYEFEALFVETEPFNAYRKGINVLFDELKRIGKDDPVYLDALKSIELTTEEEIQRIVEQSDAKERDKSEHWDFLENRTNEPIKVDEEEVEKFFQDMRKEFATD